MSEPAPEAVQPAGDGSRRLTRRLVAVALVLTAAIAVAWRLNRVPEPQPLPPSGHIVYVDVEGWYRRTPDEVAARTPYELTLPGLPAGLPLQVGAWQGEDRPHDPEVDVWLRHPEVSVERTYRRADGSIVWLSAFGSRGNKSFHLFEHTPETCYPLGGWVVDRFERVGVPMGPRPLPVNYGLAHNGARQMVFAYFYVWDTPARDPERGVLSLRLAAPVARSPEDTWSMLTQDFVREIFPSTLGWRRF